MINSGPIISGHFMFFIIILGTKTDMADTVTDKTIFRNTEKYKLSLLKF